MFVIKLSIFVFTVKVSYDTELTKMAIVFYRTLFESRIGASTTNSDSDFTFADVFLLDKR